MKNNIGKQLVVSAIVAIFVFGIAYALLSDTITVTGTASSSGTLDINVTAAEWTSASSAGAGTVANNTVQFDSEGDTVTIAVNVLEYPGANSTFTITLENEGSLDAIVKTITPTAENANMTFNYSNLTANSTVINSGQSLDFTITVGWLNTSTTSMTSAPFELEIIFEQN